MLKWIFIIVTLFPIVSFGQNDNADGIFIHYLLEGKTLSGRVESVNHEFIDSSILFLSPDGSLLAGDKLPSHEPYTFSVELSEDPAVNDTIMVVLDRMIYDDPEGVFIYPRQQIHQNICLSCNCIYLSCTPHHDPYMPVVAFEKQFCPDAYYINSPGGKILKGSTALSRFEHCELMEWVRVYPERVYTRTTGEKLKGKELIKKRKIIFDEWDIHGQYVFH